MTRIKRIKTDLICGDPHNPRHPRAIFTFPFTILFRIKQHGVLYLPLHETSVYTDFIIEWYTCHNDGYLFLRQYGSARRRSQG